MAEFASRSVFFVPCYHPVKGYRAKRANPDTGKRSLVFSPRLGCSDEPLDVPCGQCIGCRLERSRQWAIRCVHEASLHEQNAFLTLTYSPEKLPPGGTLVKKHFQDFMKRYREWTYKKIRFFHCGEYGEKSGRPHYHALIFGHDFHDKKHHATVGGNELFTSKRLDRLWTHGHTLIGSVTFESAAYVARYVTKKVTGPMAENHYNRLDPETGELTERIPEYVTMSRRPGVGHGWIRKFHRDVYPFDEVSLRGKTFKPPKYYDKQLQFIDPFEFDEVTEARQDAAKIFNPDNTRSRLDVRETIAKINFKQFKRNFENET